MGSGILARAVVQAYRQALASKLDLFGLLIFYYEKIIFISI